MKLNRSVILAYTDICAVSSRCMLCLVGGTSDADSERELLDLCGEDVRPACPDLSTITVCHHGQVSVVIINAVVEDENIPKLVKKLVDVCAESKVDRLYVPTVLRVELPSSYKDAVYENSFHGPSVLGVSSLPDDVRISDRFLLTLMQLVQVERLCTSCVVVPGYRARHSPPNPEDGSLPAITHIQTLLADRLKLNFDTGKTCGMVYRGKNEPDDDPVTVMYS